MCVTLLLPRARLVSLDIRKLLHTEMIDHLCCGTLIERCRVCASTFLFAHDLSR